MTQTLDPKSRFPDFDLPLVGGGEFSTLDNMPEKFRIIVAYRGLHCPKCKAQLQDIHNQLDDVQADGHDVMAVSMDSQDRAETAHSEWELPNLPIAYGLDIMTAKKLGLFISDSIKEAEPTHFTEPGIFVLKRDGSLYAEIIQNTPFGRPDFADLISGLNWVIENDYPARGTSVA